jgi:hypothetical protein
MHVFNVSQSICRWQTRRPLCAAIYIRPKPQPLASAVHMSGTRCELHQLANSWEPHTYRRNRHPVSLHIKNRMTRTPALARGWPPPFCGAQYLIASTLILTRLKAPCQGLPQRAGAVPGPALMLHVSQHERRCVAGMLSVPVSLGSRAYQGGISCFRTYVWQRSLGVVSAAIAFS